MRSAFRIGAFQRSLQVILIAFFAATASAARAGAGHEARRPGFRGRAHQDLHQSRRHLGVEPRPRARGLGHRHRRERPRADHRLSDGGGACRRDRHQRRPDLAGDRRRLRPRDRLRAAAHARAAEDQAARRSASSADVKEQDPALVASYGGAGMVLPVHVASRREFTGSWEYLVEGAIFTSPPHPAWSGAALINREGKLDRRRLAHRRRRQRRQRAEPRQHVRADRSARADPRRSHCQGPRGRRRAALARRQRAGDARAAVRRPRRAGQPGGAGRSQARRHHRRRQRREDPDAVGALSQGLGARRAPASPCRSTCCPTASRAASR